MTSSAMNDAQKALMKDVIRVYFSGGEDVSYKSVAITSATTADEVAHMMMEKINTPGFGHHFELLEIVKGKERHVKPDEKVSDLKAAWANKGWAGKKLDDPDFRFMLVFKQESLKALDHMQKQSSHTGEKVDTGSQANLLAGLQAGKVSAAALDSNKIQTGKIAPSVSREEPNRPASNTGGAAASLSPRGKSGSSPLAPAATSAKLGAVSSGSLGHSASSAKLPSVVSKDLSPAQQSAETKAVVDLLKALLVSAASQEPLMSTEVFDPAAHPEPAAPAAVATATKDDHQFSVAITLPEPVTVAEPKKQEEAAFMSDLDSMLANLAKATAELDN